jgi:putative transcriptional regulator
LRIKLKDIRLKNNLTHEEIAKKVGINRATYTNIELGHKNPSLDVAIRIKKALNYKDDDIFLVTRCQNGTKSK